MNLHKGTVLLSGGLSGLMAPTESAGGGCNQKGLCIILFGVEFKHDVHGIGGTWDTYSHPYHLAVGLS